MLIVVRRSTTRSTLCLAGRLDAYEVPAVRTALRDAIDRAPVSSSVELDLSLTDFLDSRALHELLDAQTAGHDRGVTVRVGWVSSQVKTIMDLAGVTPTLTAA